MRRSKINAVVDVIALLVFVFSTFSGVVLWQVLPSGGGYRGGRSPTSLDFWGLARHDWMDIHNISSLMFVVLVVIHLILHWNWFKNLMKTLRE